MRDTSGSDKSEADSFHHRAFLASAAVLKVSKYVASSFRGHSTSALSTE